jgi:uncharacterized membrane protein YqjE
MMKKRDFLYIFYGLKIIFSALAVLAFIFGVVWLFVHYHRFAIGFSLVVAVFGITCFAWAIGQQKYWDEDKGGKK